MLRWRAYRRFSDSRAASPRVDGKRVISGIIFIIRNGLRWRDVPPSYGPHKTIYNRFIRWSESGVFGRIFLKLAKGGAKPLS